MSTVPGVPIRSKVASLLQQLDRCNFKCYFVDIHQQKASVIV